MNANEKMWDAVKILMQKSFWGQHSSIESLIWNLQNEVQEFVQACRNEDSINAQEEAADVIMMLQCMLYKMIHGENFTPDEISNRITKKLHWRYNHLYCDMDYQNDETELQKWSNAKKVEHRMSLMVCDNQKCSAFRKAGMENIRYVNGGYSCKLCSKEIIPSRHNTLLYQNKKAACYMKEICASIVTYSEGVKNAAVALSIDYPDAFRALCTQLLNVKDNKDGIMPVFIDYVQRKYQVDYKEVKNYLDNAKEVSEQMRQESLLENYYRKIQSGNYSAKNNFTIAEWQKILKDIHILALDVEKTINRSNYFNARNWDNQVVHKYLLYYPDRNSKTVIECMTLIHYCGAKVCDLTIELSNMYNCIVGCRFCASGALPGAVQYLEAIDYVKQLNTCLSQSGIDPCDFENFYVSFAGIGEPSVVYKDVAAGMKIMCDMYSNIKFNIATLGYKKECFDYWKQLNVPIRTLQIPLYHTESEKLIKIVPGIPTDYNFAYILSKAADYQKEHPECRIKVNYIPMKGMNDSDAEVGEFISILEPFKNNISVKVSFLNYTKPAEENGFVTVGIERLNRIKTIFEEHGFEAYVFGTEKNTFLGCGQLAQDNISGQI